jgi:hypothetical protein
VGIIVVDGAGAPGELAEINISTPDNRECIIEYNSNIEM